MCTECDSNEQRKCIETPVKTNIYLATTLLFVSTWECFRTVRPVIIYRDVTMQ